MRLPGALSLILLFLLLSAATAPVAGAGDLRVVVLTDAAGLGDKGFNDVCWMGVQKAQKDFGMKARFLQSREQADYASNLALAAANSDVVITLGYLYAESVSQAAGQFPSVRFIHVEGNASAPNLASFDFKSEQGGFLAGLVAGLFTKSGKLGVVAGMEIPPVEAYVSGFQAGAKTAERIRGKSIETIVTYVGSFNDPVKGKSLARALISRNVDVIFRAAGNSGIGVLEAVRDSTDVYLIAEDLDLDGEIPGRVLTSALKRMDVAVYNALRDITEGKFAGGHQWLGASRGAVDITEMKQTRERFTPEDFARIQKARELLKADALTVPAKASQLEAFQPPEL